MCLLQQAMDVSLRVVDGCVIHDKADICTRVKLANDVTYKRYVFSKCILSVAT